MNAAMSGSVFSSLRQYFRAVTQGARSIIRSCVTAAPYLFSAGDLRKEVTEQYPDPVSSRTADDLPPRTRGLLFNDIERCSGCRDCERVCPANCISIEEEPGADPSKVWVSVFDIDFAKCMFCGLCAEVCAPQSLVHTKQFEGAVFLKPDLTAGFGRGKITAEQRSKWAAMRRATESEDFKG